AGGVALSAAQPVEVRLPLAVCEDPAPTTVRMETDHGLLPGQYIGGLNPGVRLLVDPAHRQGSHRLVIAKSARLI
ncbi:MAG: hypothetical protein ACM3UP_02100, partial [Methanocella sp.]